MVAASGISNVIFSKIYLCFIGRDYFQREGQTEKDVLQLLADFLQMTAKAGAELM